MRLEIFFVLVSALVLGFPSCVGFRSHSPIHTVSSQMGSVRLDGLLMASDNMPPSRKKKKNVSYRYLRALPSSGFYSQGGVYTEYLRSMRLKTQVEIEEGFVKSDRSALTSFFLAPSKLSIEECVLDETFSRCKRVILRDIVPVPIRSQRDDIESSLMAALGNSRVAQKSRSEDKADYTNVKIKINNKDISNGSSGSGSTQSQQQQQQISWSQDAICARDGGLFDNLILLIERWFPKSQTSTIRKAIYESMRLARGKSPSPYHAFLTALEQVCGLRMTGLVIETADSATDASISLGAAVMVAKIGPVNSFMNDQEMGGGGMGLMEIEKYSENSLRWVLTITNFRERVKEQTHGRAAAKLVNCYLDEAMGLHLATEMPVIAAKTLYERVSVDGVLEQRYFVSPKVNVIRAPYFSTDEEASRWERALESDRARPPKQVTLVGQISDATTFLKMRLSEKRACLRASGVLQLPRPREGPRKVDAMMIPLLDEEVAYEVLRRLGECRGDFKMASNMEDFETRKPALAKEYNDALARGQTDLAEEIIKEFNSLATLRFDPSNPDEEVSADQNGAGGFDIEEWYWEQRKRVYGIIAA